VPIRDLETAVEALAGFELVVHLAAIPDPYHNPEMEVITTNTAINYAVFEAVRRNGIRRIVYGCSAQTPVCAHR